jgi:DNA polymerase IV
MDLLAENRHEKWTQTLAAADRLRDRFGEKAVSLAASMRGNFRERTHENPASLPGKHPKRDTKK